MGVLSLGFNSLSSQLWRLVVRRVIIDDLTDVQITSGLASDIKLTRNEIYFEMSIINLISFLTLVIISIFVLLQ